METTQEYILEKVAPLFNKKGYNGTSLSEITKATNLTKGAVYFYFRNKEDLAFQAFHLNVKNITPEYNLRLGWILDSLEIKKYREKIMNEPD